MRRRVCIAAPKRLLVAALCIGAIGCNSSGGGGGGGEGEPGAATWAKSFGGPAREQAAAGVARPGDGYVFAGTWNEVGAGTGRITGYSRLGSEADLWVVTLDALGNVEWQRSYGVPSMLPPDAARFPYESIAAAWDEEDDGQSNGTWLVGQVVAGDSADLVVTRLDAADRPLWSRSYDSGPFPTTLSTSSPQWPYFFEDEATADAFSPRIAAAPDGGAMVVSTVQATVAVPQGTSGAGTATRAYAIWVLRVDASGEPEWAAFLGAGDLVERPPQSARVAPLPNRGAVVAYTTIPEDGDSTVRIVRFDAGVQSASRRWDRTFNFPERAQPFFSALVPVDDDADGNLDALLVGGRDVRSITNEIKDDIGSVRKLDINDGSEIWRTTVGDAVVHVDSACIPDASGSSCRYVVAAQNTGPFESFVRTVSPHTGDTIVEREFPGIHWGLNNAGVTASIRYVAAHNLYQMVGSCRGGDCSAGQARIVHLDPRPDGELDIVFEDIFDASFRGILAADAGGWYLRFDSASQALSRMTRFGVSTATAVPLEDVGVSIERGYSVVSVPSDGVSEPGYLVAGEVSYGDGSGFQRRAAWLLRLEGNGDIAWQKRLDGFTMLRTSVFDPRHLLRPDADGGFVLGGRALSIRNGVISDSLARVVKLDANGTIQWLSGPLGLGDLIAVGVTPDGDYLVAGQSGGLSRLGEFGDPQWQYGYDPLTHLTDMHALEDGGAFLVGHDSDLPRDVVSQIVGQRSELPTADNILVTSKVDADGQVEWSRSYTPSGREYFRGQTRAVPVADGYLLAATIEDFIEPADFGRANVLLIRIDAQGDIEWVQQYGGLYDEVVTDVEGLSDGGFLISAWSDSMGDYSEAWMLRVGPDGRIVEGCTADLGRAAAVVARPYEVTAQASTPLEEAERPIIEVTETSVAAHAPADVVVARQCAGTVTNAPGEAPQTHTLTVNLEGVETGVVTSTPQGIVCGVAGGGTCSNTFAAGSLVTLRLDPRVPDWTWGPGCESVSSDVCIVEMDADKTIDVTFGATVELSISGIVGFGSVTSIPAGIDCPDTCTAPFAEQAMVTLSATPDEGWEFVVWSGDCSGDTADIQVTMDASRSCVARFERVGGGGESEFSISVSISNQGGSPDDRVISDPPAIDCRAGPVH